MLQYALKELTRRKSRSLLVIFGIVICTALLASALCISQAMRNAASQPFQSANADIIIQRELAECPFALVKHAGKLGAIPEESIQQICELPGVDMAAGVLELWVTSGPDETDRAVVTGVDPDYQHKLGPTKQGEDCCTLTDHEIGGRYLYVTDDHTCLVEEPYAKKHGLKLGSTLLLGGEEFTVVGTLRAAEGARIAAGEIYVTLRDAQAMLGEGEVVNAVLVRAENQKAAAEIEKKVREIVKVDTDQGERLALTTDSNVMSSVRGWRSWPRAPPADGGPEVRSSSCWW